MNSSGTDGNVERRSDRRYKVSFRVSLMREESPEVRGEVTDLSAGGCFVESDAAVNEGDLITLHFDLPAGEAFTIWGNVAFWVKETGFGIRFAAFSQGGARDKVLDLLRQAP